jgi:hypothetical protein
MNFPKQTVRINCLSAGFGFALSALGGPGGSGKKAASEQVAPDGGNATTSHAAEAGQHG